jgi:TetR/AcrR family transcriptional regulator, transcriptional repressor for nem operon
MLFFGETTSPSHDQKGARVRKGEQTRREIVEKAAPLFNQKGFEGTSMSDLMAATRLQKGGIYRHFSGKEELATESFDYAWGKAVSGRLDGVDEIENHVDRLKKVIANFVERRAGLVPGGCPLMNTAVESDDGNPALRERARKALRSWMTRLTGIIEEGIERKEIRSNVDAKKLAGRIIGSLEGALLISRLQKTEEPLRDARVCLEDYLEQNIRVQPGASRSRKH